MNTVINEIKSSISYYEDMVAVAFEPERQKYQERLKEYQQALKILESPVNFALVSGGFEPMYYIKSGRGYLCNKDGLMSSLYKDRVILTINEARQMAEKLHYLEMLIILKAQK